MNEQKKENKKKEEKVFLCTVLTMASNRFYDSFTVSPFTPWFMMKTSLM